MIRVACLVFVHVILVQFAWAASYDPLVVDPNFHPKVRDLTVQLVGEPTSTSDVTTLPEGHLPVLTRAGIDLVSPW